MPPSGVSVLAGDPTGDTLSWAEAGLVLCAWIAPLLFAAAIVERDRGRAAVDDLAAVRRGRHGDRPGRGEPGKRSRLVAAGLLSVVISPTLGSVLLRRRAAGRDDPLPPQN